MYFLSKLRQYGIIGTTGTTGIADRGLNENGTGLGVITTPITTPTTGTTRSGTRGSNTEEVEKVKDLLKGTLGFSLENASLAIGSLLADALFKVTRYRCRCSPGEQLKEALCMKLTKARSKKESR